MSLPVLTADQMRAWEAASWAVKVSVNAVVGVVGERLAARIRSLLPNGGRILLLAGKGHNGDDVRAAAARLKASDIDLVNVHDPITAIDRVRTGLSRSPALVVDGIFGIGLRGPLSAPWVELLELVNAAQYPVLAVDVPSGIDANTGEPQGVAILARWTIAVGAPKIGLFLAPAAPYIGRVEVASGIGLTPQFDPVAGIDVRAKLTWTESPDFWGLSPKRPVAAHKGDFGHLVIIAGSLGYHGAAVLAARAAIRARPGLITVITSPETYLPVASQLTGVMVSPWNESTGIPDSTTAVLVGPGLAASNIPEWLRTRIQVGWSESPLTWIADASALDWLRQVKPNGSAQRVWTPHPGEAGRLLGISARDVQLDRIGSSRRLAQGTWTLLKGHLTLVASPAGEVHINSSGNAGLAQGGTGDVLAGFVGGLLAQPALASKVETALRYAVWDHGAAADRLELLPAPWSPDELIAQLGLASSAHPADPLNPR